MCDCCVVMQVYQQGGNRTMRTGSGYIEYCRDRFGRCLFNYRLPGQGTRPRLGAPAVRPGGSGSALPLQRCARPARPAASPRQPRPQTPGLPIGVPRSPDGTGNPLLGHVRRGKRMDAFFDFQEERRFESGGSSPRCAASPGCAASCSASTPAPPATAASRTCSPSAS